MRPDGDSAVRDRELVLCGGRLARMLDVGGRRSVLGRSPGGVCARHQPQRPDRARNAAVRYATAGPPTWSIAPANSGAITNPVAHVPLSNPITTPSGSSAPAADSVASG